jgi:hypothetical protein
MRAIFRWMAAVSGPGIFSDTRAASFPFSFVLNRTAFLPAPNTEKRANYLFSAAAGTDGFTERHKERSKTND